MELKTAIKVILNYATGEFQAYAKTTPGITDDFIAGIAVMLGDKLAEWIYDRIKSNKERLPKELLMAMAYLQQHDYEKNDQFVVQGPFA